MSNVTCPKCGEENPPGAIMCGACFSLLHPMTMKQLRHAKRQGALPSETPPIVRIADTIMLYAVKDGATEILLEPQAKGIRVRYRLNGELREQMKVPLYVLNDLVLEFKHRAHLNIAERHKTQIGYYVSSERADHQVTGWRVQVLPTLWGESIVLQLEHTSEFDATRHPDYKPPVDE